MYEERRESRNETDSWRALYTWYQGYPDGLIQGNLGKLDGSQVVALLKSELRNQMIKSGL